ncbi:MAG TPA: sigma-54 dependent transcriptional regulator, partial [Bryobacteraceae bacterium]
MGRILVVEDDESLRRVTQAQLERSGYHTSVAIDVAEALEILRREPQDLVISDLNLPDSSGLELLKRVRAEYPETTVVIVTAFGTIETAIEAIRCGAYDYVTKPVHPEELRALVKRVLERNRLIEEVKVLRSAIDRKFGFENIIGRSNALMQVLEAAASVAHTDATVLIRGETGTGKELLAKAIHFNSPRRDRPFAIISCGSIPRELLESELFGHIKGSFTGAFTHKKGKVEIADGGTVFLDEIGEMPLELQVRVLRLVQEHEIEKIGATSAQKVNVRIIAATHRNLEERVADGSFRDDLYYRLAVIPITLPPLRERDDDVPALVEEFFERSKRKHGKPSMRLGRRVMECFVSYRWPGNIRELENVVERIVLLSRGDEVNMESLPERMRQDRPVIEMPSIPVETEGLSLEAVERELIVQALRKFDWNQTQAARHLDISRKTLMYRIAKYGIEKEPSQRRASGGGS